MHRVRMAVRENRLSRPDSITAADYAAAIDDWGGGWVIDQGGEDSAAGIVAFAFADRRDGNIWALFVDPAHERRGHGRALHDAMLAWLWQQGLRRAWLSTGPGTRAQAFYERAGWRFTGLLPSGEARYEIDTPGSA